VIELPASRPMAERLSPVRCGRCNTPVGHINKTVPGSEHAGLCTNCTKDERGRVRVYTYYGVAPCACGCHR
jgi:hypothetical protein